MTKREKIEISQSGAVSNTFKVLFHSKKKLVLKMSSSGTDEQAPEFRVTFKSIEQSLTIPFVHHFPLWATRLENDEDGTTTFQGGLVRSDPGNLVLNGEYACDAEKVYRFQPRESDVWITSFPKCGIIYIF